MKAMLGMALALSLGLVGCQGNTEQGGGGGTAAERGTQAQNQARDMTAESRAKVQEQAGGTAEQLAKQSHDNLRDASKKASEARTSAARQDWNGAKDRLDEAQDELTSVAKDIHPQMQADVTEMRVLADKAEASIKTHSASAQQDLDRLVVRINKLATSKVQAGGGKPAGSNVAPKTMP